MKEQDVVLDKIKEIGEARNYAVVKNPDYANTGIVRFLNDDLDPDFTFRYDFQTSYYSVKLRVGKGKQTDRLLFDYSTIGDKNTSDIIKAIQENIPYNRRK